MNSSTALLRTRNNDWLFRNCIKKYGLRDFFKVVIKQRFVSFEYVCFWPAFHVSLAQSLCKSQWLATCIIHGKMLLWNRFNNFWQLLIVTFESINKLGCASVLYVCRMLAIVRLDWLILTRGYPTGINLTNV